MRSFVILTASDVPRREGCPRVLDGFCDNLWIVPLFRFHCFRYRVLIINDRCFSCFRRLAAVLIAIDEPLLFFAARMLPPFRIEAQHIYIGSCTLHPTDGAAERQT